MNKSEVFQNFFNREKISDLLIQKSLIKMIFSLPLEVGTALLMKRWKKELLLFMTARL